MESCLICGCVKNCEKYLDNVFDNIRKIQCLFNKIKIIISFDISSDLSLKKLCDLKKDFDMEIIVNRDKVSNIRTVNIENARNKILDLIYDKYNSYNYFIMIDMDDVSSKPINIESLKDGLDKRDMWDGLFFNNKNYYDFWALSIDIFQYSLWHSNNPVLIMNEMNKYIKHKFSKLKEAESFLECSSAFGGFGIYKIGKFKNCRYRSLTCFSLYNPKIFKIMREKYGIKYNIGDSVYDCEHRYFHFMARKRHNVRLRISKKYLFPPYTGEHITHIRN